MHPRKCAQLRALFAHFGTHGAHALRGLGTEPLGAHVVRCDAVPMLRHSVFKVPRIFSVSTTAILPVVQGIRKNLRCNNGAERPIDRLGTVLTGVYRLRQLLTLLVWFWADLFAFGLGSGCTAEFGTQLAEFIPTQIRDFASGTPAARGRPR